MIRSPEIPVHWAGWQSDTWTLQRMGWEFVVENPTGGWGRMRFYLKHRDTGMVATGEMEERYVREHSMRDFGQSMRFDWRNGPPLELQQIASHERNFVIRGEMRQPRRRVDMEPEYLFDLEAPLSSLNLFREWAPKAEDIILPEDGVLEMLERIKKMQQPELAAVRERNRRAEQREFREVTHGSILTLVAA